jgi:branched-subunit amino acid transport protein
MTTFLAILATGIGTYFSRSLFILSLANRRIPAPVRSALGHVGPSVLGALIVTMLIGPDGTVMIGYAEVTALAVVSLVAIKTRNHILTLIAGMSVFWLIRALL